MIFSKIINKNKALIVQIFYNLKNHPSFHSEERLVNGQLISKRKRVLCWSINNISLWDTGALYLLQLAELAHVVIDTAATSRVRLFFLLNHRHFCKR